MSVAYSAGLLPSSAQENDVVDMIACGEPRKVSGRPVLNEFGAGFTLKHDVAIDGSISPRIVWVSRTK